jgi:hypothetical protein
MSAMLAAMVISRAVISMPEAMPARPGATEPVTVLVEGIFAKPTPVPASRQPGNIVIQLAQLTGPQLAGDLIQRLVADITAYGKKNGAVLAVQFFDGGASVHGIAFAEDLLQVAQQQRCDDVRHDPVPVRWGEGRTASDGGSAPGPP